MQRDCFKYMCEWNNDNNNFNTKMRVIKENTTNNNIIRNNDTNMYKNIKNCVIIYT